MRMNPNRLFRLRPVMAGIALSACAILVTACGILHPPGGLPLGTPIDQARQLGGQTGEYPLPGGGVRLEFARGGFAKRTDMLDFDASGRLVANRQVMNAADFATIKPGMTQADVLSRIGRPVGVFPVGYQKLQVWNWRFPNPEGDCVLFQVSFADSTGVVTETGRGYDPACDGPDGRS